MFGEIVREGGERASVPLASPGMNLARRLMLLALAVVVVGLATAGLAAVASRGPTATERIVLTQAVFDVLPSVTAPGTSTNDKIVRIRVSTRSPRFPAGAKFY